MEGRIGRIVHKAIAPLALLHGEPVDRHFVTARYFGIGYSYGERGLDEGMESVISDCQNTNGIQQKDAIIQGFARRIVELTPVPPSENKPKAAKKRERFIVKYVMREMQERDEFESPAVKAAERILAEARQTTTPKTKR